LPVVVGTNGLAVQAASNAADAATTAAMSIRLLFVARIVRSPPCRPQLERWIV
jgi:hypothetical protein